MNLQDKPEESARFLNTIFESIRDPFIILDRNYTIVKANQAYAEMKQIILEDLLDEKCYAATRNRSEICEDCVVTTTFRSGNPAAKEKKIVLQSGSEEWVEIYTYPIIDSEGVVTHVVEYVRNITDRKKSEQRKDHFIKELETLSSVDSLTGLLNRRMLFDRMKYELDRVRRYKTDLSLMFCDLDRFKEINDTYGHKAGDEVLRGIANILKGTLRISDIIGRYGGDEFLIVLPQTKLQGAHELGERIRIAAQDMKFVMPDGYAVSTSMSIGVTYCDGSDTDMDSLINRIDTALYVSKRSGKNQVYSLS